MGIMSAQTEVERVTLIIYSFAKNDEQDHSVITKRIEVLSSWT